MKPAKLRTIALTIVLVTQLFAQTRPAVELEGGIAKEQVDGDLKTAIAIYQKIAADASAPRDIRARALLHQARCYEKLGQQAQSVYRQIVRDFGDQPEAAQARERLAALMQRDHPAAPAGMTARKIEFPGQTRPDNPMDPGDTDGHRAVYPNYATGELIYGDVAGKSRRVILKAKSDDFPWSFPSRDFSTVLLVLHGNKPAGQQIAAVVNTDGTGYREIAPLDAHDYGCWNWSWNSRYVLLCSRGTNRLLTFSIVDGQIRELLVLKTGPLSVARFSPDGRFIAYQVSASSDADQVSRIFLIPTEGGEPQPVYAERPTAGHRQSSPALKLLDWTADGRYLAIGSEQTGKPALHLLPIRDGKSVGAPVFVTYGDFEEGVATAAGGLVYSSVKPSGAWSLYLASLDANSRPGDWKHLDLHIGRTGPDPRWSGDSNQIVYIAKDEDTGPAGPEVVHLHNLSTEEDREVYREPGSISCGWAVQQPKLFCSNTREKTEIFSIAVDSGEIARLHTFPALRLRIAYPSRDGRALYMYRLSGGAEVMRWEIATERETILEQYKLWPSSNVDRLASNLRLFLSPDERWLIRETKQNLAIRPASGGDWRSLVSFSKERARGATHVNIAPDGNWLLYDDVDSTGKQSLARVATAGGTPEHLGDFPTSSSYGEIEISPNGSKILVSVFDGGRVYEIWSLENFVPPAPKR